jgi:CubicO group peptidase (beta-lactamase class C family)
MVFPKEDFNKASVKDADMNKGLLADMFDRIENEKINIHSMICLKDGSRVFRASAHDFTEDTKENVYSVSKSFTSVAIGILTDMKLINLDDYVLYFFSKDVSDYLPEYEALKIKHLLTMSSGQERDIFMELTPNDDIFEKFFNVPLTSKPGEVFAYHNMCTFMLSAIVTKVTGRSLNDFLNEYLYQYIGMEKPEWNQVNNINFGATGLQISTNDMARFGLLLLNEGNWDGKQIVSKEYLAEATKKQIDTGEDFKPTDSYGYGYQFWINGFGDYRCAGMFEQYIIINKKWNLVFVMTAYEERNLIDLYENHVLKAAEEGYRYAAYSLRDWIRNFKVYSRELVEEEKEKRVQ